MDLFIEIKSKYRREILKVVRDLEAIAKKIVLFRNHLVLSLRCKQSTSHFQACGLNVRITLREPFR